MMMIFENCHRRTIHVAVGSEREGGREGKGDPPKTCVESGVGQSRNEAAGEAGKMAKKQKFNIKK